MRKILFTIGLLLVVGLVACSDSEATGSSAEENTDETSATEEKSDTAAKGVIEPEQFDKMYSDPKSYKGYEVTFTGQVFVEPERDGDEIYLQVFAKPQKAEQNVIVSFDDGDFDVSTDDYVQVTGIVTDEFEGENLMGGTINVPVVEASSVEVVDYITAVAPTIKEIDVDETVEQHGLVIELHKIEIAENETRAYVTVSNHTDDTVYVDAYGTKLVTDNKQLEGGDNFESGLPEIPYDLLSGIEAEGVLTFPAVDENTDALTLHAEGHSDNYELEFKPFVFEVGVE